MPFIVAICHQYALIIKEIVSLCKNIWAFCLQFNIKVVPLQTKLRKSIKNDQTY